MWEKIRRFIFWRVAYLEDELARTRAELEKWQNALLTARGLPSIAPPELKPPPKLRSSFALPSQWRRRMEQATSHKEKQDGEKEPSATGT